MNHESTSVPACILDISCMVHYQLCQALIIKFICFVTGDFSVYTIVYSAVIAGNVC